jgi:hypothetical protein
MKFCRNIIIDYFLYPKILSITFVIIVDHKLAKQSIVCVQRHLWSAFKVHVCFTTGLQTACQCECMVCVYSCRCRAIRKTTSNLRTRTTRFKKLFKFYLMVQK